MSDRSIRPFTISPNQPRRIEVVVDSIEIDGDEDGWHLKVVDDEGWKYDFRFHGVAFDFAGSKGLRDLLDWRGEGESIRAEVRLARERGDFQSAACMGGDHEHCQLRLCVCDCHALALEDPKHPGYRELMSGLADDR